jgi:hypothetical protein
MPPPLSRRLSLTPGGRGGGAGGAHQQQLEQQQLQQQRAALVFRGVSFLFTGFRAANGGLNQSFAVASSPVAPNASATSAATSLTSATTPSSSSSVSAKKAAAAAAAAAQALLNAPFDFGLGASSPSPSASSPLAGFTSSSSSSSASAGFHADAAVVRNERVSSADLARCVRCAGGTVLAELPPIATAAAALTLDDRSAASAAKRAKTTRNHGGGSSSSSSSSSELRGGRDLSVGTASAARLVEMALGIRYQPPPLSPHSAHPMTASAASTSVVALSSRLNAVASAGRGRRSAGAMDDGDEAVNEDDDDEDDDEAEEDQEEADAAAVVVVADRPRTTLKYLFSLARGLPPVAPEWIAKCVLSASVAVSARFISHIACIFGVLEFSSTQSDCNMNTHVHID